LRSESRSRIEYLIPTNNIIVLDSYFNFTNKSNLINSLKYDLIRFFDHLGVAYFFGPPCRYTYYKIHKIHNKSHTTEDVRNVIYVDQVVKLSYWQFSNIVLY